jgi:hypothetical protein
MVTLKNLSTYTKTGIVLSLLGFFILVFEDFIWDESIQYALYLIPIGCFIGSFVAFTIAARNTSDN